MTQKTPPVGVEKGWIDSQEHGKLVEWFTQVERAMCDQLAPIFQDAVECAAIYHGNHVDPRLPHEKWRSNLHVPYGYSGIETAVAAELDILLAPDPWIQAEGTGDEDQKSAKSIEKLLQHTLVVNDWPKTLQLGLRNKRVYGTQIWKTDWQPRYSRVWINVSEGDLDRWQLQVDQASAQTGMPAPNPDDTSNEAYPGEQKILFSIWRDIMAKMGFTIGPKPVTGWQNVLRSQAPMIRDVSMFNVRCDPRVQDVQDHEVFFERIVTTKRWVWERSSDDPNSPAPFSRMAVEKAIGGNAGDLNGWDAAIARMLKVPNYRSVLWTAANELDEPIELFEVGRRTSEMPYCVMMNRQTIINRRPDELPHQHGMLPYTVLRNNPQTGLFFGISDLRATKPVYGQMDRMMNLLTDAMTLNVIPIILNSRNSGLAEDAELNYRPGAIWKVNGPNMVGPLMKDAPPADAVFRFLDQLERISDDTMSTPRQLRGAMSQVGRVSATESERRFSQGLARQKMGATTTETELRPLIHQILFLWASHGASDDRVNIGGRDLGLDAVVNMPKQDLIKALDQDYRFRGATLAVNRAERVQFIERFLADATRVQGLAPPEMRKLLAKLWQEGGIAGTIITEDGNAFVAAKLARDAQNAQATAAMGTTPGSPLPDEGGYDAANAAIDPAGGSMGTDPTTEVGASTEAFG